MSEKLQLDFQAIARNLIKSILPFTCSTTIHTVLDSRWESNETLRTSLVDNAWAKLKAEVYSEASVKYAEHGTLVADEIANNAFIIMKDGNSYLSQTEVKGNAIHVTIWDDTDAVFFRCPSCSRLSRLEVVQSEAVVTSFVSFITDDGYYDTISENAEIGDFRQERFQCHTCGHVIAEDKIGLAEWYSRTNVIGGKI